MTYPTEHIKSFELAKELRERHYQNIMTAREQGKLLTTGGTNMQWELMEGFGEYEALEGEPYGATVAQYPELAAVTAEATDSFGYGRDVCAYIRSYWGSMFLNRTPWGEFPKPDFAVHFYTSHCGGQEKWYRVLSEHYGIPYFCIDYPQLKARNGTFTTQQVERYIPYLVSQFNDFIEWVEKLTGRDFNDEKLIQGLIYKRRCQELWGEICELQKTIPAPLNARQMFNLIIPRVHWATRKEGVDFYENLLEEVKDRVARGIASQPEEKARFVHDFVPPYVALDILRHIEAYAGVLVASMYVFNWGGGIRDDRTWGPVEYFEDLGRPPRNREEALRHMAYWEIKREPWLNMFSPEFKVGYYPHIVENWKCDGVIFHLNRGEVGGMLGILDARFALKQKGIPSLVYEASASDKRDVDMVKVLDGIDAFMESLGLKKLA
ncbi:MAG: 2-hydroxyacyl-CoA dehydratase subunit D [Dehalococcoidia bacterium]